MERTDEGGVVPPGLAIRVIRARGHSTPSDESHCSYGEEWLPRSSKVFELLSQVNKSRRRGKKEKEKKLLKKRGNRDLND